MPALQGTQQGNSSAIPMTHFNAHRTCCHRHGQAVGAAHCMGDDRKQVASIPRNHCSHACDNHDCKKKSKNSEKASPQAGACVWRGQTSKERRPRENQKKRRREVRKQRVDGNCEKGPENKTRRAKNTKSKRQLFFDWACHLVCRCFASCLISKGQRAMLFHM